MAYSIIEVSDTIKEINWNQLVFEMNFYECRILKILNSISPCGIQTLQRSAKGLTLNKIKLYRIVKKLESWKLIKLTEGCPRIIIMYPEETFRNNIITLISNVEKRIDGETLCPEDAPKIKK